MTLHLNRRHFATSALLTPVAFTSLTANAQTPAASPVTGMDGTVGLMSTLEEWTAAAGEGTPVGEMGTMFEFVSPTDGVTPVTVGFTEETASFMEYTFGEETIGQEDAQAIVAGSIPQEAMPGETFLLTSHEDTSSPFTAMVYSLPSFPNTTVLSVMALGALEAEEAQVVSISISLSSLEPSGYTATGDPGGIGLTHDQIGEIYGAPADAVGEFEIHPGTGPDGLDLSIRYTSGGEAAKAIHANSPEDAPVTTTRENAMAFVGSGVPADAVVGMSYRLPSTEAGPISLEAVLWTSPELQEQLEYKGSVLSMVYTIEGESAPEVQRIDLAINNDLPV